MVEHLVANQMTRVRFPVPAQRDRLRTFVPYGPTQKYIYVLLFSGEKRVFRVNLWIKL